MLMQVSTRHYAIQAKESILKGHLRSTIEQHRVLTTVAKVMQSLMGEYEHVSLRAFLVPGMNTKYPMCEGSSPTTCPGCGLSLPNEYRDPPDRCNASGECLQRYRDLMCYTVAKQDREFIHQHAVDAYAAHHAGGTTRNITVLYGLIGLYLALEKGYTGKQVQQAHMQIAKIPKDWPRLEPPSHPAGITVMDVLMVPDPEKDAMIRRWMEAVWKNWADRHAWVRETTDRLMTCHP